MYEGSVWVVWPSTGDWVGLGWVGLGWGGLGGDGLHRSGNGERKEYSNALRVRVGCITAGMVK